MAYLQVKNILASARNMRRFMGAYLLRHEKKSHDDEMRGLFLEMRRHEELLNECLDGFANGASEGQAETWIQFPDEGAVEQVMEQLTSVDEQEDEVVLQFILNAENALLSMYEHTIAQAHAPRVRELFEELMQLEEHYLRTIASNVSELGQERRPPATKEISENQPP